ncbi:hypothetical protein [Paraclostridium bifermentans]|uniref:hypothetical protein n=1 Tax=Paraclostridium bifermentans TaxID=1490 RepID=UPI001C821F40|nr:hypothetical protein [Paraclostridium bifermentans]GIM32737.1 hypothetical protein PAGU1678_20070 [Paraclostridium bifermentans subsp. muricolitidis]
MNINIGEIVNIKIKEMEENKVVEKLIEETIEKSITTAITGAIDGWTIKRTIEKKVEDGVNGLVNDIGFTAYNTFITDTIKGIMQGVVQEDLKTKIVKTVDDVLLHKRESIKLSEIFEEYRDYLNEELDYQEKYDLENFIVEIEDEDRGWITYRLNKEEDTSSWRGKNCDIEFTIHENYKDESNGTLGWVKLKGKYIDDNYMPKYRSGFEDLLINLLYNKTKIEIDVEGEDDIDTSFDIEY